jgi:hypothetical protein
MLNCSLHSTWSSRPIFTAWSARIFIELRTFLSCRGGEGRRRAVKKGLRREGGAAQGISQDSITNTE